MDHFRNKATVTFDWFCYTVSALAIFYMFTRHALLSSGHLKSQSLACGDCIIAAWKYLIGLCLCCDEPTASIRSPASISSYSAKMKEEIKRVDMPSVIFYGTFGCLFFYTMFGMERSICYMAKDSLAWLPLNYCYYAIAVAGDLYVIAKSFMYATIVGRLKHGFQGSVYAFSDRLIHALFASVGAYGVGTFALYTAFARGKVVEVSNSLTYCFPAIPNWMLILLVSFDVVFVTLVVYLFASSLSKMHTDFSRAVEDEESRAKYRQDNAELLLLPLKYTILSIVAVLSTFLSLLLLAFADTEFIIPFDCALNCASLVLMTGLWAPVYEWLCTPLLKCMAPCLPCVNFTEAHVSELVRVRRDTGSQLKRKATTDASAASGVTAMAHSTTSPPPNSELGSNSQLSAVELSL